MEKRIDVFLQQLPKNKVVYLKSITALFDISKADLIEYLEKMGKKYLHMIVLANRTPLIKEMNFLKSTHALFKKRQIAYTKDKVDKSHIWDPLCTNFYLSLQTDDSSFIEFAQVLSHKLSLQNPNTIQKKPNQYHITLADLHGVNINNALFTQIDYTLVWLPNIIIDASLQKPIIDKKKQKVVFRLYVDHNPYILTLHHALSAFIPRKTEKKFTPHITLLKILKSTQYSDWYKDIVTRITTRFNKMVITANIDGQKEISLFEKNI